MAFTSFLILICVFNSQTCCNLGLIFGLFNQALALLILSLSKVLYKESAVALKLVQLMSFLRFLFFQPFVSLFLAFMLEQLVLYQLGLLKLFLSFLELSCPFCFFLLSKFLGCQANFDLKGSLHLFCDSCSCSNPQNRLRKLSQAPPQVFLRKYSTNHQCSD